MKYKLAKFCEECGFKCEEFWTNCPKCGAELRTLMTQAIESTSNLRCRNCGIQISEDQNINFKGLCSNCIRLEKSIDHAKAKSDATYNFGCGSFFIFLSVVIGIGSLIMGNALLALILVPIFLCLALINFYYYKKNKELSKI